MQLTRDERAPITPGGRTRTDARTALSCGIALTLLALPAPALAFDFTLKVEPGFAVPLNGYSVGPTSKFQSRPTPFNGNCDPTLASSPHSGGIQTCMADGSVRNVSASVTGFTWWYLITTRGGEVIPADGY